MMPVVLLILASFLISCGTTGLTTTTKTPRITHDGPAFTDGVTYDEELWDMPISFNDLQHDLPDLGIEALWIRSDYKGQESYAFAYLGRPASGDGRAVVLLHGGGGTAYYEWVQQWTAKGYIALALDLEGHVPKAGGTMDSYPYDLYEASPYPTPHNQNYGDASLPLEETWMHYATRTAILAHSFLRQTEGVDPQKIGVVGISWGGVIASIITGYDDRFAFSVPIYCSLNQLGTDSTIGGYYLAHPEAQMWDDDTALSLVSTPIHFVVSNIDQHYRLDSAAQTVSHVQHGTLTVLKDWLHSHRIAVEAIEPYLFANQILDGTASLGFATLPGFDSTAVELRLPEGETIESASLVYSTDGFGGSITWSKRRLTVEGSTLAYEIPVGTTMFYLSVVDKNGFTWSTPLSQL